MYKVIIVDDEHWVLRELRSFIDWAKMDLELVGEAGDGEDACALVERCQPHIVITDMNMPGLNGLGFMEWLRGNGYTAKVIVLSGYGDFEYTKPSFLLDAFDYLLKPLNESELTRTLLRAVEELKQESGEQLHAITRHFMMNRAMGVMKDNFLTGVIHGVIRDENEMLIEAEDLHFTFPMTGYQTVAVRFHYIDEHIHQTFRGDWKLFYYSAINIMEECLGETGALVYRNMKKTNELGAIIACPTKQQAETNRLVVQAMEVALRKYLKMAAATGIGDRKLRLGDAAASYADAIRMLEDKAPVLPAGGTGSAVPAVAATAKEEAAPERVHAGWRALLDDIRLLLEGAAAYAPEELNRRMDELFGVRELAAVSVQDLKRYLTEFAQLLEPSGAMLPDDGRHAIFRYCQQMEEMELGRIQASFKQAVMSIAEAYNQPSRARSRVDLIGLVKKHVKDHYATVTLDEISRQFFMNKNYLCTLFKSETGVNFSDYLTRIRMEQAKALLAEGHLKTYEVALKVGYKDQRYFSQVFRKYMGVQPGVYRSSVKQHST